MSNDWLANLKAGDTVVRSYGYGLHTLTTETVTRTTPTQVHTRDEKFYRADGALIGGRRSFATVAILEPTPERLATIRHAQCASMLSNYKWARLPLAKLEAVLDTLSDLRDAVAP